MQTALEAMNTLSLACLQLFSLLLKLFNILMVRTTVILRQGSPSVSGYCRRQPREEAFESLSILGPKSLDPTTFCNTVGQPVGHLITVEAYSLRFPIIKEGGSSTSRQAASISLSQFSGPFRHSENLQGRWSSTCQASLFKLRFRRTRAV